MQPRKPVINHADYTASTRQHELNHTDQGNLSALKDLDKKVCVDDLSDVCNLVARYRLVLCKGRAKKSQVSTSYALPHTVLQNYATVKGLLGRHTYPLRVSNFYSATPAPRRSPAHSSTISASSDIFSRRRSHQSFLGRIPTTPIVSKLLECLGAIGHPD